MTTINNIEDLIKLLDENPQWVEALRARLLTRELMELPEKFAQFATRELMELPEKFAQFATVTNQRLDNLEGDVQELKSDVQELKSDVQELKSDVQELKSDVRQLKSDVQGIRVDLGPLKGAHARNSARREDAVIAWELGFTLVRTLRSGDLLRLSQENDSAAIPRNQLRSFYRADLVMEATDQAGESCYVAVEVSYTVDGRDTERAIRNAGFLTRFTGMTAYAAVAGLRFDDRIRPNIESSEVLWYEMDTDDLEPE
jgi:outer membrane murein-binding lipoprotein Lpp